MHRDFKMQKSPRMNAHKRGLKNAVSQSALSAFICGSLFFLPRIKIPALGKRGYIPHMIRTACALTLLLLVVGCSQTKSENFDLSVTNQTSKPITIWLCKSGPPYEDNWLSPEELVQNSPKLVTKPAGAYVPAGRTAHASLTGLFDPDSHAILRIYATTGLDNILAISQGSLNRIDMPLDSGSTHVTVDDKVGHIEASTN
jgi:hypothetical protein